VVLLDEPWSNIDPLLRASMRDDLAAILRDSGVTVVLVTHDREEAFSIADRIAVMRDGRVIQVGTPEELYFSPADRWVGEFVGAANVVAGRPSEGAVHTVVGSFRLAPNGTRDRVEILVRPELIELRAAEDGAARVVGREFRGHDVFYRVVLPDGTTVCSQRPSTEDVPLGARVHLHVHDGPVAVVRDAAPASV
jgi:iron(III) transport system ATP-binding protein